VFWHTPTQRWVMVVTFHGDRVRFYTSENLRDWTFASAFGVDQGAQNATWECPDLFELPVDGDPPHTQWVLNLSTYHRTATSDRVGMQYFIGSFDGTTFTNANPADVVLTTDHGRDNYAVVTWSDVPVRDGRRLMIGWMNDWTYARATPTEPWRGALTIARELRLRQCVEGVRLLQRPVAEIEWLRRRHTHWTEQTITPTTSLRRRDVGAAMEIVMTIQPGSATECGVRVESGEREHTTIGYDVRAATLFIPHSCGQIRLQRGISRMPWRASFPYAGGHHAADLSRSWLGRGVRQRWGVCGDEPDLPRGGQEWTGVLCARRRGAARSA